MPQLITVTTDNSRWMHSIESAELRITHKKTICITKHKMSSFSQEERSLVWKCIDNEMIRNDSFLVKLTKEEMQIIFNLSEK